MRVSFIRAFPAPFSPSESSEVAVRLFDAPLQTRRRIFLFAYALYVFGMAFETTTFNGFGFLTKELICSVLQVVALTLFVIKFVVQSYSKRQIIVLVVGAAVAAISVVVTHDFMVAWAFVFIGAGQDITLEDVARVTCYMTASVMVLACIGWVIGLNSDVYAARDNGMRRYAMGFSHTNRFANCAAIACVGWVACRPHSPRKRNLVVIAVATLMVFVLTNSRTTVVALVVLLVYMLRMYFKGKPVSPSLLIGALIVAAALSMGIMAFYTVLPDGLRDSLNALLTYRPYYFNSYYQQVGVTLFGVDLSTVHIEYMVDMLPAIVIDNSYVALLLGKGVLVFALIVGSFICCFLKARTDARYQSFCLAMAFFVVSGFAENTMTSIATDFCLLGISYLLYGPPFSVGEADTEKNAVKVK